LRSRVAIAGFTGRPAEFRDDEVLIERLRGRGLDAAGPTWDDPAIDWDGFDLVVARSPWDYTTRLEEFLAWTASVRAPLENSAEVIAWNSDKRYLADLRDAGVPIVATTYIAPGEEVPPIASEVVVKPTLSAGARNTGRFRPEHASETVELIGRIHSLGRTAMVQPYLSSVESSGETAIVLIGGEISHVLRKRSLLRADEVAPVRTDGLGVAEVMYDPDLVVAGAADDHELALAGKVLGAVRDRFGVAPLVVRVDMLRDAAGSAVLLELEAIEPNLYFSEVPEAADRLADAIVTRLEATRSGAWTS